MLYNSIDFSRYLHTLRIFLVCVISCSIFCNKIYVYDCKLLAKRNAQIKNVKRVIFCTTFITFIEILYGNFNNSRLDENCCSLVLLHCLYCFAQFSNCFIANSYLETIPCYVIRRIVSIFKPCSRSTIYVIQRLPVYIIITLFLGYQETSR